MGRSQREKKKKGKKRAKVRRGSTMALLQRNGLRKPARGRGVQRSRGKEKRHQGVVKRNIVLRVLIIDRKAQKESVKSHHPAPAKTSS